MVDACIASDFCVEAVAGSLLLATPFVMIGAAIVVSWFTPNREKKPT